MSTPLSEQTPAEKLEILGRKHAVSHFEKGNFLDSPNEEVQKWLDRNQVMTTQAEFDQLFDAYCKGFQSYHVEKWISNLDVEEAADLRQRLSESTEHVPHKKNPSPASRLFKPVADQCPACGLSGAHFCTRGMPLIDCPECGAHGPHVCITGGFVPGVSSLSPASSPVPSPLVFEVVKAAQELLERLGRGYRPDHEIHIEISQCITALRNYSPAPSQSVELLRESAKALKPFAHPDLSERAPSMPLGDDAPVYGRNSALLHLGDFRRAVSTLSKLNAALA